MATNLNQRYNIGYASNGQSGRWLYATFSNQRYDRASDCMLFDLLVEHQYQHQRTAYTGAYGEDWRNLRYEVYNGHVGDTANRGTNIYAGYQRIYCNGLWQYSGLCHPASMVVKVPRGLVNKTISVTAPSPGWDYAFWNYAVGGSINTPDVDWTLYAKQIQPDGSSITKPMKIVKTDGTVKVLTSQDIVKISNMIRYIEIRSLGSTANLGNHIVECQAFSGGVNVALGKSVTSDVINSSYPLSRIVDGSTDTNVYADTGYLTIIDLGQEYTLNQIKLWRYWADGRKYYKTSLLCYDGNYQLCWKCHDYRYDGEYNETSAGKTYNLS